MRSKWPRPDSRRCNGLCSAARVRAGLPVNSHRTGPPIMSEGNPVHVAVGLLMQSDQQVLLNSRPVDKPWAYWWELPGGTNEAGESPPRAVAHDLQEELKIVMAAAHS